MTFQAVAEQPENKDKSAALCGGSAGDVRGGADVMDSDSLWPFGQDGEDSISEGGG